MGKWKLYSEICSKSLMIVYKPDARRKQYNCPAFYNFSTAVWDTIIASISYVDSVLDKLNTLQYLILSRRKGTYYRLRCDALY
jgi:hypothetical protein